MVNITIFDHNDGGVLPFLIITMANITIFDNNNITICDHNDGEYYHF
jgi:hypothetical protein